MVAVQKIQFQQTTCTDLSEAQALRKQFKLIEGGAPSFKETERVPQQLSYHRPHPKHSGLACFLIALIIVSAICVVSVMASQARESKFSSAIATTPTYEYVVSKGDSLWSIASTTNVQGYSTSDVVSWIQELNDLDGGLIQPGQTLLIPYQSQ